MAKCIQPTNNKTYVIDPKSDLFIEFPRKTIRIHINESDNEIEIFQGNGIKIQLHTLRGMPGVKIG